MTDEQVYVFDCFQSECEQVFEADDEDELVKAVTVHMSEAHDTFELEDVILANSVLRKRD